MHRRKPIRATIEAVERRIKDTGSAVRIPARPSADHAVDERQPVAKSHIDAGWQGQEIRRLSEREIRHCFLHRDLVDVPGLAGGAAGRDSGRRPTRNPTRPNARAEHRISALGIPRDTERIDLRKPLQHRLPGGLVGALAAPLPHDFAGYPLEEVLRRFAADRGAIADDLRKRLQHDVSDDRGVEARGDLGQSLQSRGAHAVGGGDQLADECAVIATPIAPQAVVVHGRKAIPRQRVDLDLVELDTLGQSFEKFADVRLDQRFGRHLISPVWCCTLCLAHARMLNTQAGRYVSVLSTSNVIGKLRPVSFP